ncbi:xanthine dehydrogenase family protein molybdopterin-binding subunit [soil metagenome]
MIERRSSLGTSPSRIDGPDKVLGKARFAAEIKLERMVHAALVHSTIARGSIVALHLQEAERAPGVQLVMTHRNAPTLAAPPPIGVSNLKAGGNNILPVMQDDEIRWNGQVVAVVLADTQEQADHAASLIRVDYRASPARTRFAIARADATTPDSLMIERNPLVIGDAESALTAADHQVDAVYSTPWQNQNPVEPNACVVSWEGEQLRVHDSTQMLNATAYSLAKVFGIEEAQVHVTSPFVGGGFGSKGLWDHQILAIAASKLVGRPVRVVLTRKGLNRLVGGRSATEQRLALGADGDACLKALIHTGYAVRPDHSVCDEGFSLSSRTPYASETFLVKQQQIRLDVLANSFMRAPGEAVGTFALESAMDELAHSLQIDPIELRRRNVAHRNPATGAPHSRSDPMAAYDLGARRFGWERRSQTPSTHREGEWLIGFGCASGSFPYVRMPGMSAQISIDDQGRASVSSAAHEMGMGTTTAQAQHAADRLGLALDRVVVTIGDTQLPFGTMAGGSSQTASLGKAISVASDKLLVQLRTLVGKDSVLWGLKPSELELADAGLRARADHTRHVSYVDLLRAAGKPAISAIGVSNPPLEALKFSMHSSSAIFCKVRVSSVTGEVRVSRVLGSFDCGRILNPLLATSQFRGGIVMGLGLALTEESIHDERSGRIMSTSLADYHVPVHLDVPDIEVLWTDIPDPRTPLGARGIGEIGVTGVAAAVANAVFNATGKRVRDLPITLDKVMA